MNLAQYVNHMRQEAGLHRFQRSEWVMTRDTAQALAADAFEPSSTWLGGTPMALHGRPVRIDPEAVGITLRNAEEIDEVIC